MNTKILVSALLSLGLLIDSAVLARETAIQISPRIGSGTIRIDANRTLSHDDEDLDALSLGVNIGVVTPIGLMFEGGVASDATFTLFGIEDHYELSQLMLAIGYQFETENGFRIVPKAGRTRWKLYDKEGELFNPGPEETHTFHGYDYFWELTMQKRIRRSTALGVSFRDNAFEFGSTRSIVFTVTFNM